MSYDLPRPATPDDEPSEFVGIERLSNVRIAEDGWVRADRPKSSEVERFWNPLEEFQQGGQPYLALITVNDSEAAIVSFLENYGTLVEDRQRTTQSEVVFRLENFRRERWVFGFVTFLAGTLKNPDSLEKSESLRKIFLKHIEQAAPLTVTSRESQGEWQHVMGDIRWAFGSDEPFEPTNSPEEYTEALLRVLKKRLETMSEEKMARAARNCLVRVVGERVRERLGPNLNFGFNREGKASLYIHSENLLDLFYWMLAQDIRDRRVPVHCAYCGRFFPSNKKNEIYCPDRPRCKERGRRRLDWQTNKDKYNRNRRLKRRREREKQNKQGEKGNDL